MIVPADCSVQKEMRRFIDASSPIIEYIDNLFLSRNISLDWWTDPNWTEDQVYSLLTSCCWRHQFILFIVIYSALVGGGCSPFFLCRTHGLVLVLYNHMIILARPLIFFPTVHRNWWTSSSSMISTIHLQISFFLRKKIAGALLCHLRRRSNCTSRAEANITTTQTMHADKKLHHHNLGEEPKVSHQELRCHRQCCATPKAATHCKPERQPELLHRGVVILMPHTHDRRSPCSSLALVEY